MSYSRLLSLSVIYISRVGTKKVNCLRLKLREPLSVDVTFTGRVRSVPRLAKRKERRIRVFLSERWVSSTL